MSAERGVTPEKAYKQHQEDERRVRNAIITAEENVEKAKTIGDSIDHEEVSAEYQEQAEERIAIAVTKKDYIEANRLIIGLLQHREGIRQLSEVEQKAILEKHEELKRKMKELEKKEKAISGTLKKRTKALSQPPKPPEHSTPPTPESLELAPLLQEQLTYWTTFYQENNYHWVHLPDSITLAPDQLTQMQELMSQGFTKILIIPDNLVDNPKVTGKGKSRTISNPRYELLHQTASQGYNPPFTGSNYDADGKFQGSKDKTTSLRIILTKDVQNLGDDELFKATKDLSIEQLEKDPRFSHLLHLTESAYLVHQQEYFKRTGKHLDKNGSTWLPGSGRPLSGRVPLACWLSGGGRLGFYSYSRDYHDSGLGCRLAGSFEVKV